MNGTIIVIEGTDGSGKKTQTEMLLNKLKQNGYDAISHSFPSYDSPSSAPVKMYLSGQLGKTAESVSAKQASILFAADRVATFLNEENGIKSFYENGGIVVLDRYVYSNMIHQACKINDSEKIIDFLNWLTKLEFEDLLLPKANLIFFLDMPTKKSKALANSRQTLKAGTTEDIHEKDEAYLEKSYETAKSVATNYGWTQIKCLNDKDEIKTIDEISDEIFNIVKNFLENKKPAN